MRLGGLFRFFLVLLVGFAGGCASFGANQADLGRRASFDLNCPEGQIRTVDLGGGSQGVEGCGKRATYVEKCDGQPGYMGTTCGWVLNNQQAQQPSGGSPPPAQP